MTHPEILRTERFGSRDYERRRVGRCGNCGAAVMSDDVEMCEGEDNEFFCSYACKQRDAAPMMRPVGRRNR